MHKSTRPNICAMWLLGSTDWWSDEEILGHAVLKIMPQIWKKISTFMNLVDSTANVNNQGSLIMSILSHRYLIHSLFSMHQLSKRRDEL